MFFSNAWQNYILFQADDKGAGGSAGAGDAENQGTGGGASGGGDDSYEDPVAYAKALEKRLAERDAKLAEYQGMSKEYEELKKARQKQLEEQGNFKALLDEAKSQLVEIAPKAEAYDSLLTEIREQNVARIEQLTAEQQAVVKPLAEKLSPVDLRNWLDGAGSVIGRVQPGKTDAGRGADNYQGGGLTADQRMIARQLNLTDEEMLAQVKKDS